MMYAEADFFGGRIPAPVVRLFSLILAISL